MTVEELLTKLSMAFPAFNAGAVEAWAPVFRARFGHREGPKLADAYEQTLGEFSVKRSKALFPVPIDFEAHMPSIRDIKTDGTGPIGQMLDDRYKRAQRLYAAWYASQGLKIKAARPASVYGACSLEAYRLCKAVVASVERIVLTPAEIAICEQRAVTSERVHRFGALPKLPEVWQQQCAEIRAEWAK